jgi:hypothetical protein
LPVPGTPSVGPFPTRDQLVQVWGDHVIGRLRPKAKALFQAGRFVGVEGDRAVFGLPNEIHRTRCLEVQGEIETVLSDHFARPVGLVLVVDDGASATAGDDGAPQAGTEHAEPTADPSPSSPTPTPPSRPSTPSGSGQGPPAGAATPAPRGRPAGPGRLVEESADIEDLSVFDESQLGEVADIDNSAESRLLQAFPGAEEVG